MEQIKTLSSNPQSTASESLKIEADDDLKLSGAVGALPPQSAEGAFFGESGSALPTILNAALQYAKDGRSVIPCDPTNKKPLISWLEFQKRIAGEDEIREWWTLYPKANVGIVTGAISGLVVIDIDDMAVGVPALQEIVGDIEGPTCQTPRGGQHLYFKAPDPAIPNNAKFIPGCDLRGEGGYVCAPPSKGKAGEYVWLPGLGLNEVPLPDLPAKYLEALKKKLQSSGTTGKTTAKKREPWTGPDKRWNVPAIHDACKIEYRLAKRQKPGETKWQVRCPNGDEHTDKINNLEDAYITQYDSGEVKFNCSHGHCQGDGFIRWEGYRNWLTAQGFDISPFLEGGTKDIDHGGNKITNDRRLQDQSEPGGDHTPEGEHVQDKMQEKPEGIVKGNQENIPNKNKSTLGVYKGVATEESRWLEKDPQNAVAGTATPATDVGENDTKPFDFNSEIEKFIATSTGYFHIEDVLRTVAGALQNRCKAVAKGATNATPATELGKYGNFITKAQESKLRDSIRNKLFRLCLAKKLERDPRKDGTFKKSEIEIEEIDIFSASAEAFKIALPFGILDLMEVQPKNVLVCAGVPDAGKTAFCLNVADLNIDHRQVFYFSSEMGKTELMGRLRNFPGDINRWRKRVSSGFIPIERNEDFHQVIKPNDLNIIDFLEVSEDFYKVGTWIKQIHSTLKDGVALIALQKKKGEEFGRGGVGSAEKARLYVNLDRHPTGGNYLKIVKAKNWITERNPNGLWKNFRLVKGCRFIIDSNNWNKD